MLVGLASGHMCVCVLCMFDRFYLLIHFAFIDSGPGIAASAFAFIVDGPT